MADMEVLMNALAGYFAGENIIGSINKTNESKVMILDVRITDTDYLTLTSTATT